jgi:hypothetical protein
MCIVGLLGVIAYGLIGQGGLFASYVQVTNGGSNLFSNIALGFENTRALKQENSELRQSLEEHNTAALLAQHNAESYLGVWKELQQQTDSTQSARVIARPPYTAYDQYVLSTAQVVGEQSLVVGAGQFALGYITKVQGQYSLVQLFSAAGEEVVVSIDGVLYTATGRGGGTLEVKLPRSYRDTTGTIVELAGGGPWVLGILTHTEFDPQDSFVRGIISLPINIYTQELVTVEAQTYEPVEEVINSFDNEDTQTNE